MNTADAVQMITDAKARGARVLCSRCRKRDATLLISCDGGKVQGTACPTCWAAHIDLFTMADIAKASGMLDAAFCGACGADPVTADHITITDIT